MTPSTAGAVAHSLATADARGLTSHGVSRMGIYARRLKEGAISPHSEVSILEERASTLLVDGRNSMGVPVALETMDHLIKMAKRTGIAMATVRNSNHFGMAGYIAEHANRHGMIGYAASNGPSRMPAYGGSTPVFGTSPFACSIPRGASDPIVVDMATCVVARGKIIVAARAGETIPEGWALDSEGNPTTDPHAALLGSVLPFAGPKGSAIALIIEVLAGVLSGTAWGTGVGDIYSDSSSPSRTSHTLAVIDIRAFGETEAFFDNLEDLVAQITVDAVDGQAGALLPGEREKGLERLALSDGLELSPEVAADLNQVLESVGVATLETQSARIGAK